MSDAKPVPDWVEMEGRLVWSEGWEANRGTPFSPGMEDALRELARQHLDDIYRYNSDPKRVGPEKVPAMAWVLVNRLLAPK